MKWSTDLETKIILIYVFEMSFLPSPSPSSCPFEGELGAMGWVKGEDCLQPTEVINSIKFWVYFCLFCFVFAFMLRQVT